MPGNVARIMDVANCFTYEEAIKEIRGCLFKELKAIESLVMKMIAVGSKTLCEMDTEMIRKLVNEAHKEAHQASNVASGYVRKIQSECEKLTEEKGKLQKELEDKKGQLESLQHQLKTIEEEKEMNVKCLQEAESSLQLAEEALQRLKDHEKAMETGRNVGIGLLFIPFIGLILGAATIIGCEVTRQQACEAEKRANGHMVSQKENVSRCESDLRACLYNIQKKMAEITETEKNIQALDYELTSQHELLKKLFETDNKLKTGATVLNNLSGKVEVLKIRSENFARLDALLIVVGDIILHISHLPLPEAGKVLCLEMDEVNKLKSLIGEMKAIDCSDVELDEFC
ncbi:uncharacterized protein LOC119976597 [Scyliorhinus canicula]|uniref:uncharacterized protein LOC119976597 n=1 Tax=Scyliorhinus canicula TaxID=7830 RepID=UPI0018F3BA0F|nr:uncharacterized protein LOC119976597 [Scyliorhinus canicula]